MSSWHEPGRTPDAKGNPPTPPVRALVPLCEHGRRGGCAYCVEEYAPAATWEPVDRLDPNYYLPREW